MSSRGWSKVDKGGEKKEEEEEGKATPRRKRVTLKEGEEERVVTPTPGPEGDENEGTPTPTTEEAEQETPSDELAAMGQKVEEIKASLVIRYERVSQSNPAILVSVANPLLTKGDGEANTGEVVPQEEKEIVPAGREVQSLEESALTTGLSSPDLRILFVVMGVVTALLTSVLVNYAYSTLYSAGPATMFEGLSDGDILAMTEKLQTENKLMLDEMVNLQEINLDPIKIKGKDGAKSRQLREEIHQLIAENEELRLAVGRLWLSEQPQPAPLQKAAFSDALTANHKLRSETEKLKHLGSDLQDLQSSVASLKEENNDLRIAYADFKYHKVPIPKELDVVSRETESIAKQVIDASRKRKPPPNLPNAKNYVTYMGQILSTMSSLHEFGEASAFGKIDIASDVFTDLVPKPSTVPPAVEQKIRQGRAKFQELKASLATKWGQLKSLSEPENIRAVGRDTLAKMNRVLVNVVSKLKEIGQTDLLRRGKTPVEKTATALADKLTVLDEHFDHTWNDLEAEVNMEAVDEELAREMIEDDGTAVAGADEDEEEGQEEPQLSAPVAEIVPTAARTQKLASERAQATTAEAQKPKEKKDVLKKKDDMMRVKEEKAKGKVNNSTKKVTSDDKKNPVKKGDGGTADDKKNPVKKGDGKTPDDKKNPVKKGDGGTAVDKKGKEIDKSKKMSEKKPEGKTTTKVQSDKKSDGKRGKKLPKKADRDAGKDENNNDVDGKDIKSSGSKALREGKAAEDGKEGGRYFKGHYNKDKTGGQKKSDSRDGAEKRKHFKRGNSDDHDDEDDKNSSKVGGSKKSGLNRHWEKPQKRNFFRDSLDSRRQFIRRKDF